MTYKTGDPNNRPFHLRRQQSKRPTSEEVINSNETILHKNVTELIRLCYKYMPEPLMEQGGIVSTLCEQIEASMKVLDG